MFGLLWPWHLLSPHVVPVQPPSRPFYLDLLPAAISGVCIVLAALLSRKS